MKNLFFFPLTCILSFCSQTNFYISNHPESCDPSCDGSETKPFSNLPNAFSFLSNGNLTFDSQVVLNFLYNTNSLENNDFSVLSLPQNQGLFVLDSGDYEVVLQGNGTTQLIFNINEFFFLCSGYLEIRNILLMFWIF